MAYFDPIQIDKGYTGSTVYRVLRSLIPASAGEAWDISTSALATLTTTQSDFAITMAESPSGTAQFSGTIPSALPAGRFAWTDYLQVGDSAATTDLPVNDGEGYWDGTNIWDSYSDASIPLHFSALEITSDGAISEVSLVDALTTYTGNTVQTGDAYAYLGTNLGALGANATAVAGIVWNALTASYATTASFGKLLGAVVNQSGDAYAYLTTNLGALGANATSLASAVWSVSTRILTAGTNIALAKGTGLTGLNDIAATDVVSNGAITTSGGKVSEVALVDTLTTYTNNTPQSGDSYARLGSPAGDSVSADIAGIITHGDANWEGSGSAPTTAEIAAAVLKTPANLLVTDSSGYVTAGTVEDKVEYSLSQSFPAHFADLAITASTGYVTVGTNEDKTGYSLETAPPTASAIAALILADPSYPLVTDSTGAIQLAASQSYYAPAKAGDEMDLVDAPNATAVTAIQNGLATGTEISDLQSHGDDNWEGSGGGGASAADVATAVFTDLLSGSDFTTDGSFGALIKANLNAPVGSIPTDPYTGTPPTTTEIAAAILSSPANLLVTDSSGYVTAGTVSDKTGYALTQSFPTNFASLGISEAGAISKVTLVDTLTTYTDNTPQTADVGVQVPTALVYDSNGLPKVDLEDVVGSPSAGRTGYVGIDWGYIYAADAAVALSGTTIGAVTALTDAPSDSSGVTTLLSRIGGSITISGGKVAATMGSGDYSGNTVQTGDAYARLGEPAGDSIAMDIAAVETHAANIDTQVGAAGAGLTALGDSRLGYLDADVSSRMVTFTLPSNFSSLAITSSTGYVTAGTVEDKTGYALATAPPTASAIAALILADPSYLLVTDSSGYVTAGTVEDKTGYALTQEFPANFSSLGIQTNGHLTQVDTVTNGVTASTVSDKTGYSLASSQTFSTSGSVGSVASGVTVATNNDKTGYSLETTPPTASAIATAVLTDTADTETDGSLGASIAIIAAINSKTTNLPAAPASTTNITAGTITTVTNLTNAPTAGDFTAAMKTSLNAATPTVTVGGYASGQTAPTTAEIAAAILKTPANLLATDDSGNVSAIIVSIDDNAITGDTLDSTAITAIQDGLATADSLSSVATAATTAASEATAAATAIGTAGAGLTSLPAVKLATSQPNYAPAKAGAQMDLVDAPNSTAIAAMQNGLATADELTSLQSHGDSIWATATGFATPGNVTSAVSSLETHGDNTWSTVTASAIESAVESAMTTQGYTTTRAGYLDTLNGIVASIKTAVASLFSFTGTKPAVTLAYDDVSGNLPANVTQVAGETAIATASVDFDTLQSNTADAASSAAAAATAATDAYDIVGSDVYGNEVIGNLIDEISDARTIYATPFSASISNGLVTSNAIVSYANTNTTWVIAVTDANGNPVNLSGKTVAFLAFDPSDPTTATYTVSGAVGGTSNSEITVIFQGTAEASLNWSLVNSTDEVTLGTGTLTIYGQPSA